jgi:hypothetical protein
MNTTNSVKVKTFKSKAHKGAIVKLHKAVKTAILGIKRKKKARIGIIEDIQGQQYAIRAANLILYRRRCEFSIVDANDIINVKG